MPIEHPFHEGELAVQHRVNQTTTAAMNGGGIADRIPDRALRFIERQPMVVIGSLDRDGRVWASALFGPAGLLRARDACSLILDVAEPRSAVDDPLWRNLQDNPNMGMLIIDLASRRRLRINGRARGLSATQYAIDVEMAYPNCPKYIQRREWREPAVAVSGNSEPSRRGESLTEAQRVWISAADTFFVASAHPERGVDASHRGGRPGFVKVLDERRLRIPDYPGNSMYNTLGNFLSYPRAGLIFVDFERGRTLQLTGRPEIQWQRDDPGDETGGTGRYWELAVDAWQESVLPLRLDWELVDYSPFNPMPNPREGGARIP